MTSFFLDGSALAKRYAPETGSALVDFILENVPDHHVLLLNVGVAEVVSVLVRKRNASAITAADFNQAIVELENEIIRSSGKCLLAFGSTAVIDALAFIMTHSINATDAIILRVALDTAAQLRSRGDDLVLVASDQRLLRAAQAEGLATFNPETQDETALAALVSTSR